MEITYSPIRWNAFRSGVAVAMLLLLITAPLPGQFGDTVHQFPQIAINGGSITFFTVHNPSAVTTISVAVQLYSPTGSGLANSQVELGPGQTQTLSFGDAQQPLTRGWAELKSSDEFIATEFFQLFVGRLLPLVGVLPSPPSEEIRFLGFVNDEFRSGLAVHNPDPAAQTQLTVRIKDAAGQQPAPERVLTLQPLQSEAAFLNDPLLFGESLIAFEGIVEISSNSPEVSVVSLIQATTGDVATVSVEAQSFVLTGSSNTALGRGALVSNVSGLGNTAAGVDALSSNNSGSANTAAGVLALSGNTTGSLNTAVGAAALASNTNGNNNTASGAGALTSNTDGGGNTATGADALRTNTTAGLNTATGFGALQSNLTGSQNTASGASALRDNESGVNNTASGSSALLLNTTGSNNTVSGVAAMLVNLDGEENTANGVQALRSNTSGSRNTANGFVALASNETGELNTASGVSALAGNVSGRLNTGIGALSLGTNITGELNTALGYLADVTASNLTNATAIGAGAKVDASNKIRFGNNSVTVLEAPVGLSVISDRNRKENFQPADREEVLRKLRSLEVPSWNYIGQDPQQFRHYGPMAQEFFAAFGNDGVGAVGTPTTININDLTGVLMIAVQALEELNTELEARVEGQDAVIRELKERLARLEQR